MKNTRIQHHLSKKGFALISTITIMALLMLVAVGMLNLSSVTTRVSSAQENMDTARANARLALMMALSSLQETVGDDRRITADGSLLSASAASPYAVGVWKSWTPGLATDTRGSAPTSYTTEKDDRFVRWLVSGPEDLVTQSSYATSSLTSEKQDLFGERYDGFKLEAAKVFTEEERGAYAWGISQENTKAKINVTGPELADRDSNDDLHAQPRPNLSQSGVFTQPTDNWNDRAAKLIDFRQVSLDPDLAGGTNTPSVGAHFTTSSYGLLTNTATGGLKVDLSLGFEMSDDDFKADTWDNPFRSASETAFSTPSNYDSQRPLYQPLVNSGSYSHQRTWGSSGGKYDDDVHSYFPVTAVPTFDTLRSYYRIPHHLYKSSTGGLTVFERANDHVATVARSEESIAGGHTPPPHVATEGAVTQTAIRPVLDRVLYVFSLSLSANDTPQYSITPIVTLWNPYNVALEIEGAVTYPWLDLPMYRTFWVTRNGRTTRKGNYLSRDLQKDAARKAVRQIPPYFFGAITADGNSISGTAKPIYFEPGEVRIFVPASSTLQDFTALGSDVRGRTIFMRPVDSIADYNDTGGFNVKPQSDAHKDLVMSGSDSVRVKFDMSNSGNTGSGYPMCIALADAEIAKGSGPSESTRGLAIADIMADDFVDAYLLAGEPESLTVDSPSVSFATLSQGPAPVFSLEVYHRVAKAGTGAQQADLVYTGNPRQSSMNSFVTQTGFQTGPQYKVRMRQISSTNEIIETFGSRPAAFYGESQSSGSGGRTHLSFFEIPTTPLISLAGFQHADLSPTPFAPANQFGNSWASAYVPRDQIVDGYDGREVDHSYLVNEALWDGYFLSSAAPEIIPNTNTGSTSIWNSPNTVETKSLESVLTDFADNPSANPLRNSRMKLIEQSVSGMTSTEFATAMIEREACTQIAQHLMVDGAFNINSTSAKAWTAMLSGLRGSSFELANGSGSVTLTETPFSRFRNPLGAENDNWQGFRSLSDTQIEELAEQIVIQVRERGPFLSLGEFVNRRIDSSDLGLSGALQTAIDNTPSINSAALQGTMDISNYDTSETANISPQDTGVGIPGYLTQADLLQSIAPIITPRSDTFIIRAYGETLDSAGNTVASAMIEATVQRSTDFVDKTNSPDTKIDNLSDINKTYGREFIITSFRYLPNAEIDSLSQ